MISALQGDTTRDKQAGRNRQREAKQVTRELLSVVHTLCHSSHSSLSSLQPCSLSSLQPCSLAALQPTHPPICSLGPCSTPCLDPFCSARLSCVAHGPVRGHGHGRGHGPGVRHHADGCAPANGCRGHRPCHCHCAGGGGAGGAGGDRLANRHGDRRSRWGRRRASREGEGLGALARASWVEGDVAASCLHHYHYHHHRCCCCWWWWSSKSTKQEKNNNSHGTEENRIQHGMSLEFALGEGRIDWDEHCTCESCDGREDQSACSWVGGHPCLQRTGSRGCQQQRSCRSHRYTDKHAGTGTGDTSAGGGHHRLTEWH